MIGKLQARWSAFRRNLSLRRGRLVQYLTTYPARKRLGRTGPLTLLVDSSVLAHGITHESAWISGGKKMWGPHEIETGYQARVPVHADDNNSDLFEEIRFLPGIAHLARLGLLRLCTSAELRAEQFRQPAGRFRGYYYDDLNLFSGIEFKGIDGWQLDFGNAAEKQLDRVANCPDPRFRALVALLGQKHSLDAYHVASAERHGLYAFLHLDLKFSRHVEQHRQHDALKQLQTRILLPSELAAWIGLLPMNPRLLSHEESSFFVRDDLHLPEQRRRGPKKKKP